MSQSNCFICQKHRGQILSPGGVIYEDDLVYAGHAFPPNGPIENAYLGYLMIEPKRHVPGLAELTEEEARRVGWLITRLSGALKASEDAEHIYLFVLGHSGAHLHHHLVPRYPGTPREYWGVRVDEWPRAPRGNIDVINEVCKRLRGQIE